MQIINYVTDHKTHFHQLLHSCRCDAPQVCRHCHEVQEEEILESLLLSRTPGRDQTGELVKPRCLYPLRSPQCALHRHRLVLQWQQSSDPIQGRAQRRHYQPPFKHMQHTNQLARRILLADPQEVKSIESRLIDLLSNHETSLAIYGSTRPLQHSSL